MAILLGFAFLAGVFTILSPCILPILPAILSAGTLQGRWRPLGIILGLVCSFTFFTLFLTAIVHATGLSPDFLRYAAILLLILFGLIMIFPKLSGWFAQLTTPVAEAGQKVQQSGSTSGFTGGLIFGVALGLLWTPCAGPILAAIITLVATQDVSWNTFFITLAYSIGAGIPMFIIAYGGSKVIQSSRTLSAHAEGIRQFFGVLMIVAAVAIFLHWDMVIQQRIASLFPTIMIEDNPLVKTQLARLQEDSSGKGMPTITQDEFGDYGPAPEFMGIINWINTPPLSLKQLKGKVVLVDFWTYSCINCLRTLPYLKKWDEEYRDKGLVIVGVHTPEFEFEKDPKNVAAAAGRLGVKYPIAQDNDYQTWKAYHNHYWPAHYLIDQNGHFRLVHFGEGAYADTENGIRRLLGMAPKTMHEEEAKELPLSPETYLGYERGHSYAQAIHHEETEDYHLTVPLMPDQVGLEGRWKIEGERITAEGADNQLAMYLLASKVYLVMDGYSQTPVEVYVDGQKHREFEVHGGQKYDIADVKYGVHHIVIKVPKDVSSYAFTFG